MQSVTDRKLCSKCGKRREASMFYQQGRSSWCRPCTRRYVLDWRVKNAPKRRAHKIVELARKNGALVRPNKCSKCAKIGIPVAHHPDYSKPLKVIWLCDSCHLKLHWELKQNGKKGGRPRNGDKPKSGQKGKRK